MLRVGISFIFSSIKARSSSVTRNLICTVLFLLLMRCRSFPFRGFGTLPNKPFCWSKRRKWVPASYACYVTFIPSLIQHRERQKMLAFAGINQKNIKQEAASSHTGNGFYLSSFISSSMALSIAGRYFSGQSCTLYFTRWYCSVSCFRSSGLKYFSAGNLHR